MSDEPTTYPQVCSMKPEEAARVREMIALHREFSAIEITVNSDRETYDPFLADYIPVENVLVTFKIPLKDVPMPVFYRELRELPMAPRKEREG